ncbi:MAG: D-alanyl-D-alanine carboxypeptidase/D-alanyl-D-alanine-endopeptidase [Acidimicrobiia bacterium]|nr:D-alanyl-D-alanine carboxypeptidase/D-alanyl-D-alanine-endopeptidase [Acidimicrobiia bacterium]
MGAVALTVVALAAGAVAAWPSPRGGASTSAPLAAPVIDAARVPEFVADVVADARLGRQLDAVLGGRGRSCLTVDDMRGPTIYSERSDVPLAPASNLKLLTATAVLDRIPGGERLHTEVRAAQAPVNGVVAGDLWLVGAGDPLLATADFASQAGYEHQPRPSTPLEDLATRVAAAGVRKVRGRVIGDESRYDSERVVPTWSPSYLATGQVGPMSALTVNDNFAQWTPGVVPAPSPAATAATVFARLLQAHGVQVAGSGEGGAPSNAPVVTAVDSAPVADVVGVMLTQSDNLAAELLTKELGRRFAGAGTTPAGLAVIRGVLGGLGLPTQGVVMVDGSGLDRSDRATCQVLLQAVERGGPTGAVARGLSVAGRLGTLLHRFGGTPLVGQLRAKTGTLSGVAAFTGWVTTAQARQLAFSFLVNGLASDAEGRALEDGIAAALYSYPATPSSGVLTGDVQ